MESCFHILPAILLHVISRFQPMREILHWWTNTFRIHVQFTSTILRLGGPHSTDKKLSHDKLIAAVAFPQREDQDAGFHDERYYAAQLWYKVEQTVNSALADDASLSDLKCQGILEPVLVVKSIARSTCQKEAKVLIHLQATE